LLFAGAAAQRLLDPVGDRAYQQLRQLGFLDLFFHDLAQRRALEHVALERGRPGRVARAVDALQRGHQQLVLIGIGEQLDFVDGRHDAEHRTDVAATPSLNKGTFSDS
jgi:hypothetical protein